jgi:hypothetical protein
MNLRSVPRAAVGGYIKAVRWPLDRTARLLGRGDDAASAGEVAIDRADAAAREVAGTALGDPELKAQAARRRTAADERERARQLRDAARAQAQEAERTLEDERAEAEHRRAAAERQAEARRAAAERAKAADQDRAEEAEHRRKEAAERAAARQEEEIDATARRDRLAALDDEEEAIAQREAALTAADEAKRLRSAASRTKAERKATG